MKINFRSHKRSALGRSACHKPRRRAARHGGQSIVETGFIIVILIGLTMGLVQFSFIYHTSLTLTNLAREGARFAGIHGVDANVKNDLVAHLKSKCVQESAVNAADINVDTVKIYPTLDATTPSYTVGQPVTVEINYNMKKKFFVPIPEPGALKWSEWKTAATRIVE